jgi:hypothetical protein
MFDLFQVLVQLSLLLCFLRSFPPRVSSLCFWTYNLWPVNLFKGLFEYSKVIWLVIWILSEYLVVSLLPFRENSLQVCVCSILPCLLNKILDF